MKEKFLKAKAEVDSNILHCREICDNINCYAKCMRESSQRSLEILKSIKERTSKRKLPKQ